MLKQLKSTVWEVFKLVIITLIIVIPVRTYIAQPFIVSGASMYPTFDDHEYLIVDELSYLLREPKRGEVIIFRFPDDPKKFFIKRIIALPEETVTIAGSQVSIKTPTGKIIALEEPYIDQDKFQAELTKVLKKNEYFVMGDNRPVSYDSRNWGALPDDLIAGRALVRLFPPHKLEILPGSLGHYK